MMAREHLTLRWGIIGIGRHADRFMAPAIQKSTAGKLAAVYSRDLGRARQFAAQHGAASAYDSIEAMLEQKNIDAVYIGSPNHVHREHALLCARAGKHVLCDKPLATTRDDALAIIEACRKAGVKLGVGFHLRHNPVHIAAREKTASIGELLLADVQYMHVTAGEIRREVASWRTDTATAGGGEFISTGVHAIDLLRFVTGKEITQVAAFADDSWRTSGCERLIQTAMTLEGNLPAALSAGSMRYPLNHLILYGTKATVRCTGSLGYHGGGKLETVSGEGSETVEFPEGDVYLGEVDAFAESIRLDTEPEASGDDGLQAVKVAVAIYDSLREQTSIKL